MLSTVVAATVTGCSSNESAVCVSNDVGDVCADESDGAITFSERTGSWIGGPGPRTRGANRSSFRSTATGAYAPPAGSVGFLSARSPTPSSRSP